MIVKNEEKYLARCLESVRNKVDEIIIVDTGSTDKTLEIAKQYTNDIYHFNWVNDFAAARNESIKYAKSDYILILDADEYLDSSADLQEEITSDLDYYFVRIINDMSYGRTLKHTAIRLFANYKGLFYRNRLHEHLNVMDENSKYKGSAGEIIIYHSGYKNEIIEDKDKKKRNLSLMLQETKENPTGYNLFNMGKTYMWLCEYEKAIPFFQRSYPLSKNMNISSEIIVSLSNCLKELHRYEEGLQILKDAIPIYPQETDMRFVQGCIFMDAGYKKDALMAFEKCLEIGDHGITVTEGNGSYMARFKMAEIYEEDYQLAKSYDQIVQALQTKKLFAPALIKYFELVSKANISNEEVYQSINMIYNVSSITELQLLLDSLYSVRHPLLNKYLKTYEGVNVQSFVLATAAEYDKEYEQAKELWLKVSINESYRSDVMLLAFILKDLELYNLILPTFNLSNKEAKTLKGIILCEPLDKIVLNSAIEEILLSIITKLIVLQEFDLFEQLTKVLLSSNNTALKCRLCDILMSYGFIEVAIDILAQCFKEEPSNIDVLRLLGDCCLRAGYLEDAQLFYSKLLNLNSAYSTYERCYDLYEKYQDVQGMKVMKGEIKKHFPLAEWIRGFNAL
ncbi:glycosyltransferase [Paenibacillus sp. FSL L8-0696]|uniref:glycosyltransferase n=1 Tax=Paenibacillus sp. FSL L8-0696 TaxID=2954524 RepID=UPI00311A2638